MTIARIILLGTGTGVPDADREHTHLVWDGPGGPILVDAGGSTYQRLLQAGVDPQTLAAMVLTHSHPDHVNGLPALLFSLALAGRRGDDAAPLPVYGLAPALENARRWVDALDAEGYVAPVDWREIAAGDAIPLSTDEWTLRTTLTRHSRPCIALRWDAAAGTSFTYSCDTAPCPAVEELARGTDLLIHEATTPGPFSSHTSPRQAGEVAARAGAGRLILVHFSPRWTMSEADALAEVRAGGFQGAAEIGRDGQALFVGPAPA